MQLTGELIRFLRQNVAKMSQREFGQIIGYSYGYVCQVETGSYPITKRFEKAVIHGLDITEADVMKYRTIMKGLAELLERPKAT